MFKLVIVVMLIAVIASLFSGLFFLYRDQCSSARTVKALTVRVILSIVIFTLLLVGYRFGLISGYSH